MNDLQKLLPDIMKELHLTLSSDLKPCDVHNGSNKNLWGLYPRGDGNPAHHEIIAKRIENA